MGPQGPAQVPRAQCTGACVRPSLTAAGVAVRVGDGSVLACAHPRALGPQWQPRSGVPLRFRTKGHRRVHRCAVHCPSRCVHVGRYIVIHRGPGCGWPSVRLPSDRGAVGRGLCCTRGTVSPPWGTTLAVQCVCFITQRLPRDLLFSVVGLRARLQWCAGRVVTTPPGVCVTWGPLGPPTGARI